MEHKKDPFPETPPKSRFKQVQLQNVIVQLRLKHQSLSCVAAFPLLVQVGMSCW